MSVMSEIERFIVGELLMAAPEMTIGPDDTLLSTGMLDSMSLLRLVAFLEERFGVTVGDGELIPANFETLNKMKSFLEAKSQR